MFAVPGWKVSGAPIVGKEKKEAKKSEASTTQQPEQDTSLNNGKRKRDDENKGDRVSGEALEKMWNKQFADAKRNRKDKSNKKQRVEKQANGSVEDNAPARDHPVEDAATHIRDVRKPSEVKMQENGPVSTDLRQQKPKKDKLKNKNQDKHSKPTHADSPKEDVKPIKSTLPPLPPPAPAKTTLTPLQQSMRNKLISSRFRHLNEALYTTDSNKALTMFSSSPELFAEYHAGFSQQVKDSWPENPVDVYIRTVKARAKLSDRASRDPSGVIPIPRRPHGTCTIADLGCGDAPLARGLQSVMKSQSLKLYNFDLHSPNTLVTKADISSLPLKDGEIDIAVFCLSLMGTNWISFVEEAWRILRGDGKGEVWVAEVKSRFGRVKPMNKNVQDRVGGPNPKHKKPKPKPKRDDDASGNEEETFAEVDLPAGAQQPQDDTDVSSFVDVFQRRGFQLRTESVNKNNKMFVTMVFTKTGVPTAGKYKGMKWVGTRYEKLGEGGGGGGGGGKGGFGKKRFLDESAANAGLDPEEERKVLKPCVYKIR